MWKDRPLSIMLDIERGMDNMEPKLSNNLLSWYNCSEQQEPELRQELETRLRTICKPCWELKYCPYGPLVEDFPGPPSTIVDHTEYIEYLRQCLEHDAMGDEFDIPLDVLRRKIFAETIEKGFDEIECVQKVSRFETEASCIEFGHLCPAFFVSETITETSRGRNRRRSIPHATIIRVARRDNNTCQMCGKILLDREIEIDHIIPYSRGGTSDESNLRVTCIECNRRKGKKIDI